MHTLHMVDVNWDKRVAAVKGVRAARLALGDAFGAGLERSLEAVKNAHAEPDVPVLIGRHRDVGLVHAAAAQLESTGAARGLIDLSPEQVFNKNLTPDDNRRFDEAELNYSDEAYATTMTLLALLGGNPSAALLAANQFMRTTGDPEFWDEVGDVLLDVFPGPGQ